VKFNEKILEALAIAAEVCGSAMSPAAVRAVAMDLNEYPEEAVIKALIRCRRELSGRLTLAAIIERIDDGRPSADEAWAQVGTEDEGETLITTTEAMEACGSVRLLMGEDMVAARMAFRDAYKALVTENRTRGIPVKWMASLGHDVGRRVPALTRAVQAGRIGADYAARLCGVPADQLAGKALPAAPARPALAAAVMNALAQPSGPPKCGDPECNGFTHNGKPCPQWGIKDDGEGR